MLLSGEGESYQATAVHVLVDYFTLFKKGDLFENSKVILNLLYLKKIQFT